MSSVLSRPQATSLRKFSETDLKGVINLYRQGFGGPPWNLEFTAQWVEDEIRKIRKAPESHMIVAVSGPKVIAISAAHVLNQNEFPFLSSVLRGSKTAYGAALVVDEEHRRTGIASKLVGERVPFFAKRGCDLMVGRTKNPRMENLYHELGYTNTGIRDPKYPDSSYFLLEIKRS